MFFLRPNKYPLICVDLFKSGCCQWNVSNPSQSPLLLCWISTLWAQSFLESFLKVLYTGGNTFTKADSASEQERKWEIYRVLLMLEGEPCWWIRGWLCNLAYVGWDYREWTSAWPFYLILMNTLLLKTHFTLQNVFTFVSFFLLLYVMVRYASQVWLSKLDKVNKAEGN